MNKFIVFLYLCINIFPQWLSYDRTNELFLEKEVGLINIGDKSSFLYISKIQEYPIIYSENGNRIFTKPEKEYFDITFDFIDLLKYNNINKLKTIDISNEKGENLKNIEINILKNDLLFHINPNKTNIIINFIKNSKILKISFFTDEGKKITENYKVEDYEKNEKLIVSKKVDYKGEDSKKENLNEKEYKDKYLELTNAYVYKNEDYIFIRFKILNKGDKIVDNLSVLFRYFDKDSKEIGLEEFFPIFDGSLFGDLEPYSVYKMKENDYFYIKSPIGWSDKYELQINKIRIKESK